MFVVWSYTQGKSVLSLNRTPGPSTEWEEVKDVIIMFLLYETWPGRKIFLH